MNKHAFLIIAHDNWSVLRVLLRMLDDSRVDIYLHIDKEALPPKDITAYIPKHGGFELIDRRAVRWADYSMVQVTLDLLAAATQREYRYYHLLSGTDLLIKTIDEVVAFFAAQEAEFVGIVPKESWYSIRRVKYYHLFTSNRRYRTSFTLRAADRVLELLQRISGVNRLAAVADWKIYDGWQWFSITDHCARFVLAKRKDIRQLFRKTLCPDELFLQTILMNSEYAGRLHDISDLRRGSARHIDWQRGTPYTFQAEDLSELLQSDAMFARKFDTGTDKQIVYEIERRVRAGKPGRPVSW